MPVLTVPERLPLENRPLVFLAGPIQGAVDWQAEAIRAIAAARPDVWIASPRSPPPWTLTLPIQADWEHEHLFYAHEHGVILFWLAREDVHDCRRAFAQTSRFEFGWFGPQNLMNLSRPSHLANRTAVGIEPGFTNEAYLRYTLGKHAPKATIHATLEDTLADALRQLPPPA